MNEGEGSAAKRSSGGINKAVWGDDTSMEIEVDAAADDEMAR